MTSHKIDRLLRGLEEHIGPFSLTYIQGDRIVTTKHANFHCTTESYPQDLQFAGPNTPTSWEYRHQYQGCENRWCHEPEAYDCVDDYDTDKSHTMVLTKHEQPSAENLIDPKLSIVHVPQEVADGGSDTIDDTHQPLKDHGFNQSIPHSAFDRSPNSPFVSDTSHSLAFKHVEENCTPLRRHHLRPSGKLVNENLTKEAIAREIEKELQCKDKHEQVCRKSDIRVNKSREKRIVADTSLRKKRRFQKFNEEPTTPSTPTQKQHLPVSSPITPHQKPVPHTPVSRAKESLSTPISINHRDTDKNETPEPANSKIKPKEPIEITEDEDESDEEYQEPQPRPRPHPRPVSADKINKDLRLKAWEAPAKVLPLALKQGNVKLWQRKRECKYVLPAVTRLVKDLNCSNNPSMVKTISQLYWSIHVMQRNMVMHILTHVLRVMHPERRKLFPYVKNLIPDWWPQALPYKDPAHLQIDDRTYLMLWFLINPTYNFKILRQCFLASGETCKKKWDCVTEVDMANIGNMLDQCEQIRKSKSSEGNGESPNELDSE